MANQLSLDFDKTDQDINIAKAIDNIAEEIDETTIYLKTMINAMKLVKVADSIFDKLYK